MANDITGPVRPGNVQRSKLFDNLRGVNSALAAGVAVSFPILSISPGKWTVRWKGEERVVPVPGHPDIPAPFIDVVILDVQKDMSRVFYKDPYSGQRNKPDCWSSNGVKPDDDVTVPINPICATCPNDAWGSGGTKAAPKAKACQQRRRTVLVPYGDDLTNESEGGPMLLSVPPGSLTNQAAYKEALDEVEDDGSKGVPYCGVITRLSYEQKDAKGQSVKYPRIKFDYVKQSDGRPYYLNDDEIQQVLAMRDGPAVKNILNSRIIADGPDVEGAGGDGSGNDGGSGKPPKAATPATKPPPPPPPAAPHAPPPPPPPPPKPVGGHAVGAGITEAVSNPAAPPPSTRTVNTSAPKLRSVPPPVVDDGEAEAHAPLPESSMFDRLMGDL